MHECIGMLLLESRHCAKQRRAWTGEGDALAGTRSIDVCLEACCGVYGTGEGDYAAMSSQAEHVLLGWRRSFPSRRWYHP